MINKMDFMVVSDTCTVGTSALYWTLFDRVTRQQRIMGEVLRVTDQLLQRDVKQHDTFL